MALTKAHNRMIETPVVNLRDFGAVGNGTTDDSAAIQAAINSGKKIIAESGDTYLLESSLSITANDIEFDGANATFTCPSARITQMFNIDGASNTIIKNVKWSPPAFGSGSSQARMVYYKDVTGLTVQNCTVTNASLATSGEGSTQARSTSVRFIQCNATGDPTEPQNGMQIGATVGFFVDQCEFNSYLWDAIKFTAAQTTATTSVTLTTVLNSAFVTVNHTSHGLLVGDKVDVSSIAVGGITVSGDYDVIEVVNANSYKIIHSAVATSAATSSSTNVDSTAPITSDLVIRRSAFRNISIGGSDSGIDLYGRGRNSVIAENIFENCTNGVMVKNEESSGALTGNVYHSVVDANRFFNCENAVLLKYANFTRVSNNQFEYNGVSSTGAKDNYDIHVRGPITNVVVDKNTFRDSGANSIRLDLAAAISGTTDAIEAKISDNNFIGMTCADAVIFMATVSARTPVNKVDVLNNTFANCVATDIVAFRGYGNGLMRATDNNFVNCNSSNSGIRIITSSNTDAFHFGNNYFNSHTGTEISSTSTASIQSNFASINTTKDTSSNPSRYTFVGASADTVTAQIHQTYLSATSTKSTNPYAIVTGYGTGAASTANRTAELYANTGAMSIASTLTQSATFTDFAEMMPNGTGSEIAAGTILTMSNGSVVPANADDVICGVVSYTAAVLAGDTPFCWQGRYLFDEFGRREMIDVIDDSGNFSHKAPKENPNWNPDLPQSPRSERPDEWTPVGLIGQVFVRVDDTVSVGDSVKAINGIGTQASAKTGLRCMSITKDHDGNYGIAKCLINISV